MDAPIYTGGHARRSLGGAAAFLAHDWLEARARAATDGVGTATVVVATEPLAFGTELTAANVTEIPWAAKSMPDGAFTSKDELLHEHLEMPKWPIPRQARCLDCAFQTRSDKRPLPTNVIGPPRPGVGTAQLQ